MSEAAKEVLFEPTVGQVIELLSKYHKDMPFRMEDADTNWTIKIIHVDEVVGELFFSGDYSEMQ